MSFIGYMTINVTVKNAVFHNATILEKISEWRDIWDYDMFVDIWIPIIVGIPTAIFVLLFAIQIKQEKGVLKTNIKQLEITQQDFDRRSKINTLEVVTNHLNIVNGPNEAKLISDIISERKPGYETFDHDVRYILNLYEKIAIQYYTLQLDLDVIDECLGNEIIKVYEDESVKGIRKNAQIDTDLYNKLDEFYKELKPIRENKIQKEKELKEKMD